MRETIYVALLDEGTDVWAPVKADHGHADIYRIITQPEGDSVPQFGPGARVRCRHQRFF
jgi:hypothetical protein